MASIDEQQVGNPYLSAKLIPLGGETGDALLLLNPTAEIEDGIPVPPRDLWQGYGFTASEFLAEGRKHAKEMLDILQGVGISTQSLNRVLDFGCGAGRVLRFLPRNSESSEFWGVDINASCIAWCQQHLSPPLYFATTTSAPHLPFEDNYFDLVYCDSVFTHISDLADSWFLELRRVVRKGGHAFITIHDKHTLDLLFNRHKDDPAYVDFVADVRRFYDRTLAGSNDYAYFMIGADPYSQVFYDIDWLLAKWSRLMRVVTTAKDAHGPQTVLVFQK